MQGFDGLTAFDLVERAEADPRSVKAEVALRMRKRSVEKRDELARLHWAKGTAERALGELTSAAESMTAAIDAAAESGDDVLRANIEISLSSVASRLGDLDRALELVNHAGTTTDGQTLARVAQQLGMVLYWRGELTAAVAALTRACAQLRERDDRLGEARARSTLGAVLCQIGSYDEADAQLSTAVDIATELGQHVVLGVARQNLGYLASLRGDLPGAIEQFEAAERGLIESGGVMYLPRVHADHAQALADAFLFDDAVRLLDRALAMLHEQGNEIEMAAGLVTAAEIKLAQGQYRDAQLAADEAANWYRRQGRERWLVFATNLAQQAAARLPDHEGALPELLEDTASGLDEVGLAAEATRARLLAARLRSESNADDVGEHVSPALRAAAEQARPADQILLSHIDAITALKRADRTGARRAVSSGLAIAMSSQAVLGSIETRAHAAVNGYALTELGARLAVEDNRPRELLLRIEATRLMGSRVPETRPSADPGMAAMLTELRSLHGTIVDPSSSPEQRADAERDRARVERDVRRRSRTVRGDESAVGLRDELGVALALLGERQLLAHAALDGRLLAVSVVGNRARLHDLGSLDDVSDQLDGIAFSLHRLNRLQGSEASRDAAAEMLYVMTDELAELLLPPIVRDAMNPVVVVPTAVLHDVPWGLLPPLGGRAVSVNPSVSAWARAERTRQERAASRTGLRSIGFLAGPGLDFAEFEVENLSKLYIEPEVYVGAAATSDVCVDVLSRADVVHIACHGSFRTDNPMFSSLHLADGPVIVHDLERLHRLPETVILPACSVGTTKALQGGSLLGLASALTTLGACNVIAPLTPINDAASVTVMDRLHHELIAGSLPAMALAVAALEHDLTDPTAGAFITLGA